MQLLAKPHSWLTIQLYFKGKKQGHLQLYHMKSKFKELLFWRATL